jgi:hypothetical protein
MIGWNTNTKRIYETDKYLLILKSTVWYSVQYTRNYYCTFSSIINKNTWNIEKIYNNWPYCNELGVYYYIGHNLDNWWLNIRINNAYPTTYQEDLIINLYTDNYTIWTGSLIWYVVGNDLKSQLYDWYEVFTTWWSWVYIREDTTDGIYNFFSINSGALNYIYKDGTITTLGGVSWYDIDGLRYTRVFTWSITDYTLILNQTAYNTWILDDETNDNYSIIQNEFINESASWNIIKNNFYTPLLWASWTTTYFIKNDDNKLYKESKISINFFGSELTSTGWEFPTGIINLNFNCDIDLSWDIWIGEGLYCPIVYLRWIWGLFSTWFTTIYEFIIKLTELSPNI